MALEPFIMQADLATLPEPIQKEYTVDLGGGRLGLSVKAKEFKVQKDGKEEIERWGLENVHGLKTSLERERANVEGHKSRLAAFEGIDPKEAREALAKRKDFENATPTEKVAEQLKAKDTEWGKKLEEKDRENSELSKQLQYVVVEKEAISAIEAEKGSVEILLPHVMLRLKPVKGTDGKFVPRVVNSEGHVVTTEKTPYTDPMSVRELVSTMKSGAFAVAFAGSGASGSGAGGHTAAGSGNGHIPQNLSPVEKMKLARRQQAAR